MAANMELLDINIGDTSKNDNLKHFPTVSSDAEIIVKDILQDIFDTAIRKSEESQEKKTTLETEAGDLIDLTRNYKQEFSILLQNLKCQSHRSQATINSSLEDQIKKVIDEIKNLETSVRMNIEEERENTSEEIVLQVIDLQEDISEKTSSFNGFPSEEELVDVSLSDDNQTDRPKSAATFTRSPIQNFLSDQETSEKHRKKKNLGQRLWHFIRKSTKSNSCHSVSKKRDTN